MTLIEIVVVLMVLSILAAVAVPMAFRYIKVERNKETRDEMENIKKAMVGDPKKIQGGVRTDFGYLGDWGGLPDSLENLVEPQEPLFSYDKEKKVGAGWNGPYITVTFSEDKEEYKKDAWGNDYVYDNTDYTNAGGEIVDGKLVSIGPDRTLGTGDDLTIEILKKETTSHVFGYIKDKDGNYLKNIPLTIFFPQDGILYKDSKLTDANGYYEFSDIPFGARSISIEPRLIYVEGSAKTEGKNNVKFSIANYSSKDITINGLTAVYNKKAYYKEIKIDHDTYWKGPPRAGSGDTIVFNQPPPYNQYTFEGTGATGAYVVYIESAEQHVPDISLGAGTVATFCFCDFRRFSWGGPKVDMSGVTFTITFSDGSVINFTTP